MGVSTVFETPPAMLIVRQQYQTVGSHRVSPVNEFVTLPIPSAWACSSSPAICIECRINPSHRKAHSLGNRLHRIAFINQLADPQVKFYFCIVRLGLCVG